MKAAFFAIALFAGATCSERSSDQEDVIRVIEAAVKLPAGAKASEDYARNYALRPDGNVIGVYVVPQPAEPLEGDYGCELMLEDFGSRPCTEAEEAEIANHKKAATDLFGRANRSHWFEDFRDLPVIFDGGCDVIEIIFDPGPQRIESARCNGAV